MDTSVNDRKTFPPYLSITKLKELFKLLATRSFNQVTKEDLTARGFSQIDAFLGLSALRFLGIINTDNTVTENLSKLRMMGEERKKSLQEMIKVGYGKLFGTVSNANNLSREELYNEFIASYRLSPRLAKAAVPDFLWLCSEAGFEVQEVVEGRNTQPRRPKTTIEKSSSTVAPAREKSTSDILTGQSYVIPFGAIKLVIPNTDKARTALLVGKFKDIADKLTELSKTLEDSQSVEDESIV